MIFNRLSESRSNINDWKDLFSFEKGYDITPFNTDMKESTYFSCIKIISEGIAKCTLQLKKETEKGESLAKGHYLYNMLRLRPNKYMSAVDCYKTFVAIAQHEGIAGLYINRLNNGKVEGLYPVEITQITIDDVGLIKSSKQNKILYSFICAGTGYECDCFDKDLIILRDFTLDGINTKANKSIIKESLDTSKKSQHYLNKLFTNGLTSKIAVQLTSDIKEERDIKQVQSKFDRIYTNNGRVFTIPAGYNVQPLNLTLADAQFSELRKLSKEEIAMSMNVPLSKLGIQRDTAKSEEQDNIKFLTDCLLVKFQAIEQEIDYKLLTREEIKQGYKARFNVNVLLRTDAKTQAGVISMYVKNGVYDLDYAKGLVGVEKIGGDKVITLPSGQVLLKDLIEGKVSYIKNKGGGDDDNTTTS